MNVLDVANKLDKFAELDRQRNGELTAAPTIEAGALAIRTANQHYEAAYRRAIRAEARVAALERRLIDLQSELTVARANVRALEAVAARPAPIVEQRVERDANQEIVRVRNIYENERRPIGFGE